MRRALTLAACLLWTATLVAGCEKTKVDRAEDILERMIELQVDGLEQYIDMVDEYSDICNKCVRDTKALADQLESQMQGLLGQWNQMKTQMPTADYRQAVKNVTADAREAFKQVGEIRDGAFEVFEEYQENCPGQVAEVYNNMERVSGLFSSTIGYEF